MNSTELKQESISALADGELSDCQLDRALSALSQNEADRFKWELYHQIGDILRSDELALPLSSEFSERMKARLEVEKAYALPIEAETAPLLQMSWMQLLRRRFVIPCMAAAAAAMAAVAFVSGPQLVAHRGGGDAVDSNLAQSRPIIRASTTRVLSSQGAAIDHASVQYDAAKGGGATADGIMLRDQRIDDYLIAHQRFSPSVYSAAQYARSAMFATDSEK